MFTMFVTFTALALMAILCFFGAWYIWYYAVEWYRYPIAVILFILGIVFAGVFIGL